MYSSLSAVTARVVSRTSGDGAGPGFSVQVSPGAGGEQVDVTRPLIAALAHALWQARGGEDVANWADAETALGQLLGYSTSPAGAGRIAGTGMGGMPKAGEGAMPAPQRRPQQPVRR